MNVDDNITVRTIAPDSCAAGVRGSELRNQKAARTTLLRQIFGSETAVSHDAHGAPVIVASDATISITHCRGLVAVAISRKGLKIGIDAESNGREQTLRRVAPRFLSAAQVDEWSGSNADLLEAWTIKEALYKAARIPGWPLEDIPLPSIALWRNAHLKPVRIDVDDTSYNLSQIVLDGFDGAISLVCEVF